MQNHNYSLFPEITPFNTDLYRTKDGHEIYYEECGNPDGYPVVFLHGGPGSGCNPGQRRFFDPDFYKIILVDQRGCGRSKPLGSTENNTTQHLVEDLDAIRHILGIEQWLVFGGSWGSTLALNYALKHTDRTSGLILRGIFLARPIEMQWFLGQITLFYPDVWETLLNHLDNQPTDLLTAFEHLIFDEDPKVSVPAAEAWNAYESAIMRLIPNQNNGEAQIKDPSAQAIEVARARVQIHYIKHDCFIDGEAVLAACKELSIPTYIAQGRYDMVCPPQTAWQLKSAMPHAEFTMVADAGHSAMEDGTCNALIKATEAFKQLVSIHKA